MTYCPLAGVMLPPPSSRTPARVYLQPNERMYNHVKVWMEMIATPTNAKKLRMRVDTLEPPVLDPEFGPEPRQCPLTILYGIQASRRAYADPELRPALDMWDTGEISADDLRKWCGAIEKQKRNVSSDFWATTPQSP